MSKAADDVLTFLESLDNMQSTTPSTTTETKPTTTLNTSSIDTKEPGKLDNSNTTESVLKFLDDITATTTPTSTEVKTTPKIAEPVVTTASSNPVSSAKPADTNANRWNWGSIWSQAQSTVNQASQSFKTTMENAQKNIEKNEKLKGITLQFNKENIEKLGNDLKKMTVNVIDSIAPPISFSRPENETTIWLQVNSDENFSEQVKDIISYVKDEVFGNAKKNVIHGKLQLKTENLLKGKEKPSSIFGISNAVAVSDDTLKELVTLHPERQQKIQQVPLDKTQISPTAVANDEKPMKEIITTYRDIFMVVQPFFENLTRPNTEKILTHVSFYITLYYPNYQEPKDDIYMSYTSQSVSCKENMESTDVEINPLRNQIYEEWCDDQKLKAVESTVWSLFEELLVRKKEYSYDAQAIAGISGQII